MPDRLWLAGAALLLAPAALAQVTLDGSRLVVPGPVAFRAGGATLVPEGDVPLSAVATYLAEKSYISTLRIEGHVEGGADPQSLSEARAIAVARALIGKGVDCHRLVVVGFGDTKPVAAPGDAANTRVEFVNVALRGRLIGGMPADGGGNVAGDPCQTR